MTRDLIRLDPSSLHLAYVVFKDPQIRLDKTRPVFPHCGNILIGVESVSFFQDLRELVSHEAPQWADDIDLVTTVALSPAAKVRLRKELQFTNRIIRAHLRMPEDPFEPNDKLIAETALSLSRLADTLRQEVVVGTQDEEEQKFIQQRHALIVLNCWSIVRDIALIELRRRLYSVPHALSSLLSSARVWMDGCLSAVTDIRGSKQAMNALHLVFEFLHAGDPVQKANGAYLLQDRVQRFQFFIDRAVTEIGTNDYLLSRDDRAFFESAAREVQAYAASRDSKTRDSAVADQSTPESPGTAVASGPLQGVQEGATPTGYANIASTVTLGSAKRQAAKRPTTATASSSAASHIPPAPDDKPLVIDTDTMIVRCNGKQVNLSAGKKRRFTLLRLLLAQPDVPVSHRLMCGTGSLWPHNKSHNVPETQIKSLVRELKHDLEPLGDLPITIRNETIDGEFSPVLSWK